MGFRKTSVSFTSILSALCLLLLISTSVFGADLSIDDIIAKSKAKYDSISTVSISVSARQVDPSTNKATKMGMNIVADKNAGLARMTFTEPAAFKDQVMIMDQKAKVIKVYTPVTNQVVVSKIDESGAGLGFSMDLSESFKIPDKTTHDIKLLGKEKVGKVDAYIIQAKEKKSPKSGWQKLWLNVTDLSPVKIEMYGANGKLSGAIDIKSFKTNVNIDKKQITTLPADAEVIQQ